MMTKDRNRMEINRRNDDPGRGGYVYMHEVSNAVNSLSNFNNRAHSDQPY